MRTILAAALILTSVSFSDTATQTDWSGGCGVLGPVTDWGNNYYSADHISDAGSLLCLASDILTTPVEHIVDGYFYGVRSVYAADVDGDDDTDVLGAARYGDDITWWENTDGTGTVWTVHTVDGDFNGATSVYTADVDGDSDVDVLGAADMADDIAWWENTDGSGTAWTKHTVDDDFNGAASVYSADVDGDGDRDVLGAGYIDNEISWWENTDGTGTVWTEHIVDGNFNGSRAVYATDVDNDGDIDVLGGARFGDDVTWWENIDGTGTVWVEHTVDSHFLDVASVYAADVNGDGYMDVLGAAWSANDITWWDVIGYDEQGVLESSILDVEAVESWEQFNSSSQSPSGTSVAYQFRSSTDAASMGAWSDTVYSASTALSGILANNTRYIQYRVIMETINQFKTPVLETVSFSYYQLGIEENGSTEISSWSLFPAENPSGNGHFSALIAVPEPGMVQLAVFDTAGRMIAETSQVFPIGTHSVTFEGLSEGVYFCVMNADDYTDTERVVVLK